MNENCKATKISDGILYFRRIRCPGRTEGALEEAGRAEQHSTTEAASTQLKLGRRAQSDERWP